MRPTCWMLGVLLVVVVLAGVSRTRSLGRDDLPPVISIQRDSLVYTFHVLTGTEALFDVWNDPRRLRNLAPEAPERAYAMRRELSARYGVADLAELRDPEDPVRKKLQSHGYPR